MSKCESNVNELIVPGLVGIPGTVSSRLAEYRDWRGDVQADVSDLETCASNLEIQGLAITAIDFVNPCARYSEVSFELGDDAIHARLIEPVGRARVSERVPLCLMFHDIDRPVRGWHHMTRFAAMGYAVLALDDDVAGADDLQRGISSPAFVERVRWGCALAKVARNLDGMGPRPHLCMGRGSRRRSRAGGFCSGRAGSRLHGGCQSASWRPRGAVVSGARIGAHGHIAHGYRERSQGSVCRIQRS